MNVDVSTTESSLEAISSDATEGPLERTTWQSRASWHARWSRLPSDAGTAASMPSWIEPDPGWVLQRPENTGSATEAATYGMPSPMPAESIHVVGMEKWEGRITEVDEELFTAELTPLDHDGPPVLADFDISQLAPEDDDVRPGDVIYLTVRRVRQHGYATTTAAVRRKRSGYWSQRELDDSRAEARRIAKSLEQYAE